MENETDLIRQQMLETRTSLSEKLEALQEQVLSTVEGTTRTVTDTVQTVQEAVQDTVSTVSETVQDTVDTVKDTFDINQHVRNHPWLMVGGAVALGYLGGRLLRNGSLPRLLAVGTTPGITPGTGSNGFTAAPPPAAPPAPNWFETAAGPILKQVQEMALGALVGVAADMIQQHAPENLKGPLDELTHNVASALGTKPLHGLLPDGKTAKC
jgi:ElaB/YqjD/DUF883 family membrane-anchored ribosome-binding protein